MTRGDPLILRLHEPTAPDSPVKNTGQPDEPTGLFTANKPTGTGEFPDAAQERGDLELGVGADTKSQREAATRKDVHEARDYLGPTDPERAELRARWAENQRQRRARQRAGETLATVHLTPSRIDTLTTGHFVAGWDAEDPAALARGIEGLIDWLAERFGE